MRQGAAVQPAQRGRAQPHLEVAKASSLRPAAERAQRRPLQRHSRACHKLRGEVLGAHGGAARAELQRVEGLRDTRLPAASAREGFCKVII